MLTSITCRERGQENAILIWYQIQIHSKSHSHEWDLEKHKPYLYLPTFNHVSILQLNQDQIMFVKWDKKMINLGDCVGDDNSFKGAVV